MTSSSAATAWPAAARTPLGAVSFSGLGFAAFLGLLVFAQIDAVGNRLLGPILPVSTYSAFYLVAALLGACALAGDRGTRLAGAPAPGVRLAAALLLWSVVAWTLSRNAVPGWEYLQGFAKAAGLLLLAAMLVDTPQRLRLAVWAIVAAGLISALIVYGDTLTGTRLFSSSEAAASAQYGGVARSAGGSDENPTTAAHMLLVSTALLLGLFAGMPRIRVLIGVGLVICLGALGLMAARSAMVGLVPAVALFLWFVRRERAFPLILLGLAALLLAAVLISPALLERVMALGDWGRDPTLFRRTTYLAIGFDLFQQSPVWGIGPGNYPSYFVGEEYRFLPGRSPVMRELHNTYLDVAVELGSVGLLLFLTLLAAAVAQARRALLAGGALRAEAMALLLALGALLAASFFMPNKDMRYLWLLLGLAFQAGRLAHSRRAAA